MFSRFIDSKWGERLLIVLFAAIFYGGFTCITGYIDHQREFSTKILSSVDATSMDEVEWIVVRRGKRVGTLILL